nr:hypothetical protein CFP56_64168 [Quercus suber]
MNYWCDALVKVRGTHVSHDETVHGNVRELIMYSILPFQDRRGREHCRNSTRSSQAALAMAMAVAGTYKVRVGLRDDFRIGFTVSRDDGVAGWVFAQCHRSGMSGSRAQAPFRHTKAAGGGGRVTHVRDRVEDGTWPWRTG